jgi:hypothetical protein
VAAAPAAPGGPVPSSAEPAAGMAGATTEAAPALPGPADTTTTAAALTAEAARPRTGPERPGQLAPASGGRLATGLPGGRLRQAAGALAIASAVLAVTGSFTFAEGRVYRWAPVMLAATDLIAGSCMFIPRTRRLAGPGFLLGSAAVLAWWLASVITDKLRYGQPPGASFWLEVAGGVTGIIAACLAAAAVARTPGVRLLRRPSQVKLASGVILIGSAGAVALGFQAYSLARDGVLANLWVAPAWAAVMTLVVPVCATLAVPRRFGIALLGGCIAADVATFAPFDRYFYGIGKIPITAFGLTMIALVAAAVLFARGEPAAGMEHGPDAGLAGAAQLRSAEDLAGGATGPDSAEPPV